MLTRNLCLLAAAFGLLLGSLSPQLAAQNYSTISCHQVLASTGETYQASIDAVFVHSAHDERASVAQRVESITAKGEFDSLCQLDDEAGTHEAGNFMKEEAGRLARFQTAYDAMSKGN
jgi:hypothetical protein